jgi:type IV secretion system protein TrbG
MRTTILLMSVLAGATLTAPAWAQSRSDNWTATVQTADAEERKGPPPAIDPLSGPNVPLSRKERKGVGYGRQWANNTDLPARGEDGSIVFVFGSTLPTVVCAPLYVCDLVLQEGETVNDINIGDSVRWQISPATQGAGEKAITHVIIKPTDISLVTNLLITTNKRAYTIKLVSRRDDWMPRVSFQYPDDVRSQWGLYHTMQEQQREAAAANTRAPGDDRVNPTISYSLSGDDAAWRPTRVYATYSKTYIEFPDGVGRGDLPVLVTLADDGGIFTEPTRVMVNYRYVNGRFEVDKLLDRAALISGVGSDETIVKIQRGGGGW